MKKTIVHPEGAAALTAADQNSTTQPATIKLGVDVHQARYVGVAQHDHATPQPPRRFRPEEFVPFVEKLLARGHRVFVVYEGVASASACAASSPRSAPPPIAMCLVMTCEAA